MTLRGEIKVWAMDRGTNLVFGTRIMPCSALEAGEPCISDNLICDLLSGDVLSQYLCHFTEVERCC